MTNKKIYVFTSVTCSPCRTLKPLITDYANLNDVPLTIFDMDANREEFLAHNVRGVPTILVMENDKEVDRVIGHQTYSSIDLAF